MIEKKIKKLITFNCKHCNKEVTRDRKRGGFCTRSCASKKYIQDGTYDIWRFWTQEKRGSLQNCVECNKSFYSKPSEIGIRKLCSSKECRKSYMSEYMKKHNPMLGKKEHPSVRQKIKDTLLKKYGITNAFALAKHTSLSKPQKEIIDFLKKNTNYTILYDYPIYNKENKLYKVDILIKELNLIIEFNGSYWHTDPRLYKENFFMKKKKKFAKEIWQDDEKRIKNLLDMSYKVRVIWEIDYKKDKDRILLELINEQ